MGQFEEKMRKKKYVFIKWKKALIIIKRELIS